jgi:hypothetical protein
MDIDKPHQLELLREDLAKQQNKLKLAPKGNNGRRGAADPRKPAKKTTVRKKSSTTRKTKPKASTKK